jgi:hypothetical protein
VVFICLALSLLQLCCCRSISHGCIAIVTLQWRVQPADIAHLRQTGKLIAFSVQMVAVSTLWRRYTMVKPPEGYCSVYRVRCTISVFTVVCASCFALVIVLLVAGHPLASETVNT